MDKYEERINQLREEYKRADDPVKREVIKRQARALEISKGEK